MKTIGLNNAQLSTMSNGSANRGSDGKKGGVASSRPSIYTLVMSFVFLACMAFGL
jgi:hypothetical protein